jgi:hypothetical protein
MRKGNWYQSKTRPRILWSGAILLATALSVLLIAGECFVASDASLTGASCPSSLTTFDLNPSVVAESGRGRAVGTGIYCSRRDSNPDLEGRVASSGTALLRGNRGEREYLHHATGLIQLGYIDPA